LTLAERKPARGAPKKPATAKKKSGGGVPTREQILAFLGDNPGKTSKREIGRAFGVKGDDRIPLKQLLKAMTEDGLIARDEAKNLRRTDALPPVTVIEITHTDTDGELIARPVSWPGEEPAPLIVIAPDTSRKKRDYDEPPAGVGDRVLARIEKVEDEDEAYPYEARGTRPWALPRQRERPKKHKNGRPPHSRREKGAHGIRDRARGCRRG
jgi:ribonuclease R